MTISYLVGFFLPIVGIVLLIFLLNLLQSSVSTPLPESDDNEANTSDDAQRPHADSVADAIYAFQKQHDFLERHRAQREQKTLLALVVTAVFALGTVLAAIYSNVIFSGQLGEMQTATELTRESNRINRESFASVQRAFITVQDVSVNRGNPDRYPRGIQQSKFWMVLPVVENSGNTPTKHLRWMNALSVTLGPEQNPDKIAVDIEKNSSVTPSPWNYGILGPKARMTLDFAGNPVFLSESVISELPELDRVKGKMMWQGVIRYHDIFPDTPEHLTKFCYFVRADRADADGQEGVRTPYLNQCGGHTNCADDECKQETASNGK
jgi:hypothetical protein